MTALKPGSRGAAMHGLHIMLNAVAVPRSVPLAVNGAFDAAIDKAVRSFQSLAGLVVDGSNLPCHTPAPVALARA